MSRHQRIIIVMCTGLFLLFVSNGALANLIVNGGAETNSLVPWIADEREAYNPGGQIGADFFHDQSTPDVFPFAGNYFFSFAKKRTNRLSNEGRTISMSQTGTDGLDAPALLLSGWVQTQTKDSVSDVGKAILKVFDSGDGLLDSATSEDLISDNGIWMFFDLDLDLTGLSGTPAYWVVELAGTANYTTFTNVFWDEITMEAVPIPSTIMLLGAGLLALTGIRRRFKG